MKRERRKMYPIVLGALIGVATGLVIVMVLNLTSLPRSAPAGQTVTVHVLEVHGCEVYGLGIKCKISEEEYPEGLTPAYAELKPPTHEDWGAGAEAEVAVMEVARWHGESFFLDCKREVCTSVTPVTERQKASICYIGLLGNAHLLCRNPNWGLATV